MIILKTTTGIVTATLFFTLFSVSCRHDVAKSKNFKLVWHDEFDYEGLPDTTHWSYDTAGNSGGWGNKELEYYTFARQQNASVEEGILKITARKENYAGHDYTSARLVTRSRGDWLYGKVEVKAKLPRGRGLWPAIWMLSTGRTYGGWPASGEIDIMEHVGHMPDSVFFSVHTKSYNHMIGTQKTHGIFIVDPYSEFHVYKLEWSPEEIRGYLDNKWYFIFKNEESGWKEWPFDKQFHLILNLAVGGTWGGQEGVDDSVFPGAMEVDYVRVYQYTRSD